MSKCLNPYLRKMFQEGLLRNTEYVLSKISAVQILHWPQSALCVQIMQ